MVYMIYIFRCWKNYWQSDHCHIILVFHYIGSLAIIILYWQSGHYYIMLAVWPLLYYVGSLAIILYWQSGHFLHIYINHQCVSYVIGNQAINSSNFFSSTSSLLYLAVRPLFIFVAVSFTGQLEEYNLLYISLYWQSGHWIHHQKKR